MSVRPSEGLQNTHQVVRLGAVTLAIAALISYGALVVTRGVAHGWDQILTGALIEIISPWWIVGLLAYVAIHLLLVRRLRSPSLFHVTITGTVAALAGLVLGSSTAGIVLALTGTGSDFYTGLVFGAVGGVQVGIPLWGGFAAFLSALVARRAWSKVLHESPEDVPTPVRGRTTDGS